MATPYDEHAPIVIASSGQRCGSTLLQRAVASHPDAFVWGEHGGRLADLAALHGALRAWAAGPGAEHAGALTRDAHQSFMAMVSPDAAAIDAAARAFVATLFAPPPPATRSGFKEVHYGAAEVDWLLGLFPAARVVHVTRDPRDVLRSLDAWERGAHAWNRGSTEAAVRDWARVTGELRRHASPRVWSVRYEDVVADPEAFLAGLGAHVDLDPAGFDPAVFAVRIHAGGDDGRRARTLRAWEELAPDLRLLLDAPAVRSAAAGAGYAL
jgi:hypothetical protein